MIRFEDECVGCPPEMGCLGDGCRYRNVPHIYCDICGEEICDESEMGADYETMLTLNHHYHLSCMDSEMV